MNAGQESYPTGKSQAGWLAVAIILLVIMPAVWSSYKCSLLLSIVGITIEPRWLYIFTIYILCNAPNLAVIFCFNKAIYGVGILESVKRMGITHWDGRQMAAALCICVYYFGLQAFLYYKVYRLFKAPPLLMILCTSVPIVFFEELKNRSFVLRNLREHVSPRVAIGLSAIGFWLKEKGS